LIHELAHAIGEECLGGRIVGLADRSQAARPVPRATLDGVIVDSIETTGVVGVGLELVALSKPGRNYTSYPYLKPSA